MFTDEEIKLRPEKGPHPPTLLHYGLNYVPPSKTHVEILTPSTSECNLIWEYVNYRCNLIPRWLSGKESSCQCRRHKRHGFYPWAGKSPWRRKWKPTPVFLLGESHGQRSLAGYNQSGHKRVRHNLATKQQQM